MDKENLLKILASANLEHLLYRLISIGIENYEDLAQLEVQDYDKAGATSDEDRSNLFELVEYLREQLDYNPEVYSSDSSNNNRNGYSENNVELSENKRSSVAFPQIDHGGRYDQEQPEYYESDSIQDEIYSENQDNIYETESDLDEINNMFEPNQEPNKMIWRINSGVDEDDNIPKRIIREGTSTKNALLDAYGVSIKPRVAGKLAGNGRHGKPTSQVARQSPQMQSGKITVCVRKRPINKNEELRGESDIIETGKESLSVHENKKKVDLTKYIEEHRFYFDHVFGDECGNFDVYNNAVDPLVDHMFEGGNATCFAYGQTGSGKTYTMLDSQQGLYILAGQSIFERLRQSKSNDIQVVVIFYELYLTDVYDLLNERNKLHVREKGDGTVCIKDIAEVSISSVNDLAAIFEYGNKNRRVGSTGANSDSSRSHAVMQIQLRKPKGNNPIGHTVGKLSFIDLAGNERGADRGDAQNDPTTRREGSEINKSLLALKECIRALDLGKSHQPFRQSRLTLVLRDSFIGNSWCVMIATVAPNTSNCEHTLNTLRYADRVKSIRGKSQPPSTVPKISPKQNLGTHLPLGDKKSLTQPLIHPASKPSRLSTFGTLENTTKKEALRGRKSLGGALRETPQNRRATQGGINLKNSISNISNPISSGISSNSNNSRISHPTQNIPKSQIPAFKPKIPANPGISSSQQKTLGRSLSLQKKPIGHRSTISQPSVNYELNKLSALNLEQTKTSLKPETQRKTGLPNNLLNPSGKSQPKLLSKSQTGIRNKLQLQKGENSDYLSYNKISPDKLMPNKTFNSKSAGALSKPNGDELKAPSSRIDIQRTTRVGTFDEKKNIEILPKKSTVYDTREIKFQETPGSELYKNFENQGQEQGGEIQHEETIEEINHFVKQHIHHIRFLKNACKEEALAMSAYIAFSAKKESAYQDLGDGMSSPSSRADSRFKRKSSLGSEMFSPVKNILNFSKENDLWNQSIDEMFDINENDENGAVLRRKKDGMCFRSFEEAKVHLATEYLAQLDFILEAEMEEIGGMRAELADLVSRHLKQ
ncbi:hypothetical protein BB558_001400 [Smittium angustum]|uniref:Kinesin motor domain-containing protein n=1 Tax=Smittium angustum TaxID=133377 RepID=A0A2U1JBJ2_SMIAN|nr:hypothetical protein BB558_001400 [Smittium angustum]